MHHSIYKVNHSKALSVPLLGSLLYRMQIFFIEGDIIHQCWVSSRENRYREHLLRTVTQRASTVLCGAWQLGRQLTPLQGNFVFDFTDRHPKHMSLAELYCVQWALILAASVTLRSVKRLGNLIPSSYPIWSPYIISVHQPLDVQCDFIWQTIQQLLRKGQSVTVLSHVEQSLAVQTRLRQLTRITFVSSVPPRWLSLFPYGLRRVFLNLKKRTVRQHLQGLTADVSHAVLWCFDPDDIQTLEFKPPRTTTLYDCVDFHTSVNPQLQKRIQRNQKKLLDMAQLMFVNSRSLLKVHQKQRSDIMLVPQGFDVETFLRMKKTPPSEIARPFFTRLQKERRKYQGVVSYVGMMSHRVDYPLLLKVVTANPKVLFCLPETRLAWSSEETSNTWDIERKKLQSQKNTIWFPPLSRSDVKNLLHKTSVGFIPYDDQLPYNKYCFPMKFFEYMSANIPTLSTQILELKHYKPFAQTGKDSKELTKLLRKQLRQKFSTTQRLEMQKLCEEHSWENKVEQILTSVSEFQRRSSRFAA